MRGRRRKAPSAESPWKIRTWSLSWRTVQEPSPSTSHVLSLSSVLTLILMLSSVPSSREYRALLLGAMLPRLRSRSSVMLAAYQRLIDSPRRPLYAPALFLLSFISSLPLPDPARHFALQFPLAHSHELNLAIRNSRQGFGGEEGVLPSPWRAGACTFSSRNYVT